MIKALLMFTLVTNGGSFSRLPKSPNLRLSRLSKAGIDNGVHSSESHWSPPPMPRTVPINNCGGDQLPKEEVCQGANYEEFYVPPVIRTTNSSCATPASSINDGFQCNNNNRSLSDVPQWEKGPEE